MGLKLRLLTRKVKVDISLNDMLMTWCVYVYRTPPGALADALAADVVAAARALAAVAAVRAGLAEVAGRAAPLAARARVARPAHALACTRGVLLLKVMI